LFHFRRRGSTLSLSITCNPRRPKELLRRLVENYFPIPEPPAGGRGRRGIAVVDDDGEEEDEYESDEEEEEEPAEDTTDEEVRIRGG
jgi:hypothetical protein